MSTSILLCLSEDLVPEKINQENYSVSDYESLLSKFNKKNDAQPLNLPKSLVSDRSKKLSSIHSYGGHYEL